MNLKKLTRIILLVAVLLVLSIVPVNAVVFNAAFDSDFYVNCYPDLKAAFGNDANAAYNHYLTYGIKEGRIASPVFDAKTYIRNYPDLQAAFGDDYEAAYNHFLSNGMKEGRLASNSFNVQVYIANYPDLQAAFGNDVAGAYNHYLNFGMAEGRVCGSLEAGAEAPEDHVHAWDVSEYIVVPTCKADGEKKYTCACGETKTEFVSASEEYHDYYDAGEIQPADYNTPGIMRQVCRVCGDIRTVTIDALVCDHEEVEVKNVFPSSKPCTIQGEREVECLECGKIFTEKLQLEDHVNSKIAVGSGSPVNYVDKCKNDGLEEVVCDYCNEIFERVVPAHNFIEEAREDATCEKAAEVTYKCSNCGTTKTEVEGELAKHSYGTEGSDLYVEIPATCTKSGSITKICANCGTTKKTTTPALGHKKPTSTSSITYVYLDKEGEIVIDPAECEKNSDGSIKLNANGEPVTLAGKDGYKDCTYSTGVRNCEYDIAELYSCGNACGTKLMNVVATAIGGHEIDSSVKVQEGVIAYNPAVEKEPNITITDGKVAFLKDQAVDCTHAKVRVYKCANTACSDADRYIVTIIEQPKHTPNKAGVHNYPATCTTDEYNEFFCDGCQKYIQEKTGANAKGHEIILVDATCTEGETLACRRCNTTSDELKTSKEGLAFIEKNGALDTTPKGHSFKDNISTTTVAEDGSKTTTIKCGSCKEEIEITLTALNGNPVADADTTFTIKGTSVKWDAKIVRVVEIPGENEGDPTTYTYEVKGVKLNVPAQGS